MPRITTAEFLVGYIHAKMEQLRLLAHRLQSNHNFTVTELVHMSQEILDIDAEVQGQSRTVDDERVNPKMSEYYALYHLAQRLIKERRAAMLPLHSSSNARTVQPAGVNNEPPITVSIAAVTTLNPEASPFQPAAQAVPSDPANLPVSPAHTSVGLEIYASDGEESIPLEYLSKVNMTSTFRPIVFDSEGDRSPVNQSRRWADEDRDQHFSGKRQKTVRPPEQRRTPPSQEPRRTPPLSEQRRQLSSRPGSGRSSVRTSQTSWTPSGHPSYTSSRQESFRGTVSGLTYPPFCRQLPYSISKKDSGLIGRSEIYVHPPTDPHICPICPNGKHKLYRCTTFIRDGLLMRWYRALRAGVCLNCLIRGHSSFTCINVGACMRCQQRHNSQLCPKNPHNQ